MLVRIVYVGRNYVVDRTSHPSINIGSALGAHVLGTQLGPLALATIYPHPITFLTIPSIAYKAKNLCTYLLLTDYVYLPPQYSPVWHPLSFYSSYLPCPPPSISPTYVPPPVSLVSPPGGSWNSRKSLFSSRRVMSPVQ